MKGRQNNHFLEPAYAKALKMSTAKEKDLTELYNMNVIPKSDWNFYQVLQVEMYEERESEEA